MGLIPYSVGTASIRHGNALDLPIEDESVDLIVTSPPYFALRSYTDGGEHYDGQIGSEPTPQAFLEALWAVTAECRRVLKPSGSMFVNLGDKYAGSAGWCNSEASAASSKLKGNNQQRTNPHATPKAPQSDIRPKSLMGLPWRYAIGCIDNLDLILRAEVVWSKPNGLPESVTDRVRRSHEQWFHFTKEPRYFAAVDEVREPHTGTTTPQAPRTMKSGDGVTHRIGGTDGATLNPLGKLPGSVWTIPSEPLKVPDWLGVDHFAAFPQEFPRRIILGWSPSGICVECGEGRRPVVVYGEEYAKRRGKGTDWNRDRRSAGSGYDGAGDRRSAGPPLTSDRRLTGYACACPTPTAPTRPAVVLDPFGGTGTVAMVARALGRYGVHVDLSADYNRLARWRVWKSGHEYKTYARGWAEANGAMVDGKPKVPAKIRRELEAEMVERSKQGRRLELAVWNAVKRAAKGEMD